MKLNRYLEMTCKTHKEFAKEIGVSVVTISNYIRGLRLPNAHVLAKMEIATNGKVTVHDFVEQEKKNGQV